MREGAGLMSGETITSSTSAYDAEREWLFTCLVLLGLAVVLLILLLPSGGASAVSESEPNDNNGEANPVTVGDNITGAMDGGSDMDWFTFWAENGENITFDVYADRNTSGSSDLDSYLILYDTDGSTVLVENDDARPGQDVDSRIDWSFTANGWYFVMVRDLNWNGGPMYYYNLGITLNAGDAGGGYVLDQVQDELYSPTLDLYYDRQWAQTFTPTGESVP